MSVAFNGEKSSTKISAEGLLSPLIYVTMIWVMKMYKEKELPQRKHPRLNNYDYSSAGAYFVTICTQNRMCALSHIVGRGLAPAGTSDTEYSSFENVGRGLAPAETSGIKYTIFGKIAEQQLLSLEDRYAYLSVDQYVIMPNHIHVVFILQSDAAGASPRPTITDIVCAYKSLTTR